MQAPCRRHHRPRVAHPACWLERSLILRPRREPLLPCRCPCRAPTASACGRPCCSSSAPCYSTRCVWQQQPSCGECCRCCRHPLRRLRRGGGSSAERVQSSPLRHARMSSQSSQAALTKTIWGWRCRGWNRAAVAAPSHRLGRGRLSRTTGASEGGPSGGQRWAPSPQQAAYPASAPGLGHPPCRGPPSARG